MGARKPKKIEEVSEVKQEKGAKASATAVAPVKKAKSGKSQPKKARGKKYKALAEKSSSDLQPLGEALKKVKAHSYASFDAAIDAHIKLGIDPQNQDQQIRTFVSLPHGTGKTVKVLVFAETELAAKLKEAGADQVGNEELIDQMAEGKIPAVDAIISTPTFMSKLAKAARVLGPKGLMPTPKTGTVTADPVKALSEIKKGKVELKTGGEPTVHVSIGKVSFPDEKLAENFKAVIAELNRVKPGKIKGVYLQAAYLAPTMGPSVKVDLAKI
ncbi:MAG: 50S ribosomal protein L1 [Patescibacteria group bacterium]